MPCIIGIDEAGYGPNLGPFVMTAVAALVPAGRSETDLWDVLKGAVRRHTDKADARVLVADSKIVHAGGNLPALELGVRALLGPFPADRVVPLDRLLDCYCVEDAHHLCNEAWYVGDTALPIKAEPAILNAAARTCAQSCAARLSAGLHVRSVIVCTPAFNDLLDHWGSKGAVLGHSLAQLLAWRPDPDEAAPVSYYIDKHGGRNFYASMLQQAIGDGMVIAEEEGAQRSVYRVLGLKRDMRLTFQPRADTAHFCVALASMVSKYLREVLMSEFNRFWQSHVRDLKPTAGYPGDAARFYAAIRDTAERLEIPERALWRRK